MGRGDLAPSNRGEEELSPRRQTMIFGAQV